MNEILMLAKETTNCHRTWSEPNQGTKQQDPYHGQILNEDEIMKLETIFILEPSSL